MVNHKGFCLVSQQIRDLILNRSIVTSASNLSQYEKDDPENRIRRGMFKDARLESRVQPTSLDPIIGDEVFILDKVFQPQAHEQVYQTLLRLPRRERPKANISGGFLLIKGHSYLFPLVEKIMISPEQTVKSSPKSTFGRLFFSTRNMSDYNPCFDEINTCFDRLLDQWLLVQPLAFNAVIYPGMALSQLRFFQGLDARLSDAEIIAELEKHPILYNRVGDALSPLKTIINNGLQLHLDLSGEHSDGIVALMARHNPTFIDLKKNYMYDAEDFFLPMLAKDRKVELETNQRYLFVSKGVLGMPKHLSAELMDHSHIGAQARLHLAGYIDNLFTGDLVYEVISEELRNLTFTDNSPLSKLQLFRCQDIPDKLYGEEIGSHYQGQMGPRVSKHFKAFDYRLAAKNYAKLSRMVLVQDTNVLKKYLLRGEGFEPLSEDQSNNLFNDISNGFFHSRYDCEDDELILQIVPYVIVFNPDHAVFCQVRASDIQLYGETKLFKKHAIGLGGHIVKADGPEYVLSSIQREVFREEVEITGNITAPKFEGVLLARDEPVDRVHFGLIYSMFTDGEVKPKEGALKIGMMVPIADLFNPDWSLVSASEYKTQELFDKRIETWTKVLMPHLNNMYRAYKQLANSRK